MNFSDKVKYVRNRLKLSLEKFASLLCVSFATVNRWETGRSMLTYGTQQKFIDICKENGIKIAE